MFLLKSFIITYFIFIFIILVSSEEDYGGMEKVLQQLKGSLSKEQQNQAKTIMENPNLTKQDIKNQLNLYFQKLGEPFKSKYQNASNQFENQIANLTAKSEAMKSNLSQPAQILIDKILAIHKDMTITIAQEKAQIKALFEQSTPDIKKEIENAKTKLQQKFGEAIGSPNEII